MMFKSLAARPGFKHYTAEIESHVRMYTQIQPPTFDVDALWFSWTSQKEF